MRKWAIQMPQFQHRNLYSTVQCTVHKATTAQTAVFFVSQAAEKADIRAKFGLHKETIAVKGCRNVGKRSGS